MKEKQTNTKQIKKEEKNVEIIVEWTENNGDKIRLVEIEMYLNELLIQWIKEKQKQFSSLALWMHS